MLPNIVDVAIQNNLILDSRTLKNKEVRAKCPFCMADANKNKHYLSLNTDSNVYKCWNGDCKMSGGVLDFESRLTGEDYNKVKKKYFTNSSQKNKSSLDSMTSRQLEEIGYSKGQQVNEQQVLAAWQAYEYQYLSKWFAELVIISYLPVERSTPLLEALQAVCKKSVIRNAFEKIQSELYKEDAYKMSWAVEGLSLARIVWQMAVDTNDFSNVITNVHFVHFLSQKKKQLAVSV